MEKAKLLLVSNQNILREALAGFLNTLPGFRVVGDTSCYHEGLALAEQLSPELFLVDIELPEPVLQSIASHLTARLPSVGLLFFSSLSGKKRLVELIPLHAQGYLTTDLSSEIFIRLLNDALQGRTAISPSILEEVLEELRDVLGKGRSSNFQKGLTSREKDVLHQLVSGATNREIASSLVISEYTVKNHIHNMLEKFKIHNRTQLISYALTSGIFGIITRDKYY